MKGELKKYSDLFAEEMGLEYKKNKEQIIEALMKNEKYDNRQETCSVYNMSLKYKFRALKEQIEAL